jgi:predicted HicB family RNase H-like nuclease
MKAIAYKGYYARIEFDPDDLLLVGKIAGIRDVVTFHADTPKGIVDAFKAAVDDYLKTCNGIGKEPDHPYSGRLQIRVDPELHAQVSRAAELAGLSFNQWGEEVFRKAAAAVHEQAVGV